MHVLDFVSPRAEDNISISDALTVAAVLARGGLSDVRFSVRQPITVAAPVTAERFTLRQAIKEGFPVDVPVHVVADVDGNGEHNVASLAAYMAKTSNSFLALVRAYELLFPLAEPAERRARLFENLAAQPAIVRKISEALEV